jgi:hypothetical protein
MSNLIDESRLTLTALARREGVAVSTVWRWAMRGVRGVKLETFNIGVKRFTTKGAFLRFVDASTAAAMGGVMVAPQCRTNRQREAAIIRAEAALKRAGL